MATPAKNAKRIKELETEVTDLKKKLDNVSTKKDTGARWRSFFKWLSLALAGGLLAAGSIIFYVGMSLTNTDRFMNIAGPLIEQPSVQQAIATKATNALYEQVDTKAILEENLPPKLQFLAPQLSTQVQKLTEQEAQKILASPKFQDIWETTLSKAHSKLITELKNYQGDGTISIQDVYNNLSSDLSGTKLSFLSGKTLPSKVGSVTVIQADNLPTAHKIVSNMNTARILSILLLLALTALTIYLSKDRRKGVIHVGIMIALVSLAMLISLRIGNELLTNSAQPQFAAAASDVWHTVTNPYRIQMIGTCLFGVAAAIVAWLWGPSKTAKAARDTFTKIFEGKAHAAIFKKGENGFTNWMSKYQKLLIGLVALVYLLSYLVLTLSVGTIIVSTAIALLLIAAIIALSAPSN